MDHPENGSLMNQRKTSEKLNLIRYTWLSYVLSDDEAVSKAAALENGR